LAAKAAQRRKNDRKGRKDRKGAATPVADRCRGSLAVCVIFTPLAAFAVDPSSLRL